MRHDSWFIEVTSFYQHSSQGQDDEEEEQVWATWVFVPFGIRAGWRTWFERFLFWVQIHSISLVRFYWSIYQCSFNRWCSEMLRVSQVECPHSVQRVARGQRDVFDKTCCSVQPFIRVHWLPCLQQIVMEVDHSGSWYTESSSKLPCWHCKLASAWSPIARSAGNG